MENLGILQTEMGNSRACLKADSPASSQAYTKAREQCGGEWHKQNFVKIPEQKLVERQRTGPGELAEGFVTIGWE